MFKEHFQVGDGAYVDLEKTERCTEPQGYKIIVIFKFLLTYYMYNFFRGTNCLSKLRDGEGHVRDLSRYPFIYGDFNDNVLCLRVVDGYKLFDIICSKAYRVLCEEACIGKIALILQRICYPEPCSFFF